MSEDSEDENRPTTPWRERVHEIIFEADTPEGKAFDVGLLIAILCSVAVVVAESVEEVRVRFGVYLLAAEWLFTILFTIEYGMRLACVRSPWRYACSFFGWVDLLAVLPMYLSLFVGGTHSLIVIRTLRLLRIFRVFKLGRYLKEARTLLIALKSTREKITVFLVAILSAVLILGAMMYLVEGPENGFTNIPVGVYWAIVTLTTVGYGDIHPKTAVGQILAALAMILGYSIIIVPTGIFSAEILTARQKDITTRSCATCGGEGHDHDANHCKFCGSRL
ncbi:Cyclic nucleotide-gated potassium channel [Planctomycetes bacterium Pan216]|uniref:Cyclic nucleotide-gated potassium channel n=1 Tax=Kolteria novifilia TaxID=2527975 RepID=A0A518BCV5_9BACT|nr:Cyclic nucleotide-gated potassium channel [Planctomycetes bacterium Pan216]